jgi:16S rRNA (adenine1518-N6/adenine1519-N6)-dimethyltransferase
MPKYLGQHFLINKKKLRRIVDSLELKPGETIVEIGPGHGEITKELVNWLIAELGDWRLILIEKDSLLVDGLTKKFGKNKNIEIIKGDALKILSKLIPKLSNSPIIKLVGNIPYYITGRLLRVIGELKIKPSLAILTVQKEVAERICNKQGMNLLAASVQFWAKPEIIGYVSKKYFRPIPKVDSAIIKLATKNKKQEVSNAEKYYKLIKLLFKQPRKTILNNLASGIKHQVSGTDHRKEIAKKLQKIGIDPAGRPQDLSIKQIIKLSTLF